MAVATYEDVIPTLIPNTTMRKFLVDGVHKQYTIDPNDGYVLHDSRGDWVDENDVPQKSYYIGAKSCPASYDFSPVTITVPDVNGNPMTLTGYGNRAFCAVLATDVPANNIFGVTPETEVM